MPTCSGLAQVMYFCLLVNSKVHMSRRSFRLGGSSIAIFFPSYISLSAKRTGFTEPIWISDKLPWAPKSGATCIFQTSPNRTVTVREPIEHLRNLQDLDAEVLIGEGFGSFLVWLRVTGIVERRVNLSDGNTDVVVVFLLRP